MSGWTWCAAAAGLFLAGIVAAAIAIRGQRSRGKPRCFKCGYNMTGASGLDCPECGRHHDAAGELLATRRSPRARSLAGALVVGGLIASLAGYIDTMPGRWWRLAPTGILLEQLLNTENVLVRDALWARIEDGDPAHTLARPRAISPAAWAELALICRTVICNPTASRSRHAWAITTLSCVIPDEQLVDAGMESLIASTDCRVRDWGLSGVYTYWLTRRRLSDQWTDDLIAAARDARCPAEATRATHLLARVDPIQVEALVSILTGTSGANAPQWTDLALGVTARRKTRTGFDSLRGSKPAVLLERPKQHRPSAPSGQSSNPALPDATAPA